MPIPSEILPAAATMLPNMETAVNFMLDGAPLIGEQVVVFGQGIVGLLLTALLAKMPLGGLLTLDLFPHRRLMSENLGAQASLDPTASGVAAELRAMMADKQFYNGADLTYEVSGQPAALNQAIEITGYNGRVDNRLLVWRKNFGIESGRGVPSQPHTSGKQSGEHHRAGIDRPLDKTTSSGAGLADAPGNPTGSVNNPHI